jgi:hypothetical protein
MFSKGMEEVAMGKSGAATWKGSTSWTAAPEALEEEDAGLCAIASKQERAA